MYIQDDNILKPAKVFQDIILNVCTIFVISVFTSNVLSFQQAVNFQLEDDFSLLVSIVLFKTMLFVTSLVFIQFKSVRRVDDVQPEWNDISLVLLLSWLAYLTINVALTAPNGLSLEISFNPRDLGYGLLLAIASVGARWLLSYFPLRVVCNVGCELVLASVYMFVALLTQFFFVLGLIAIGILV